MNACGPIPAKFLCHFEHCGAGVEWNIMLDHREVLQKLVALVGAPNIVTVTETNFGYIIWSKKGGAADSMRARILKLAAIGGLLFVAGLWLTPMGGPEYLIKSILTLVAVGSAAAYFLMTGSSVGGIELHVDLGRREIRAASRTAKGESWIRSSARFGEVTNATIMKAPGESKAQSLVLRIAGEPDPLPVAVGKESVLLAVHDRLMSDMRPLEQRLASYHRHSDAGTDGKRRVFPSLGPSEVPY